MAANSIRDAISSGRFCYMVELVPSNKAKEEKLLEAAAQLAQIPGMVGAGITSYAGGGTGEDPIRVGAEVCARGLTPNVHITCVNRDGADLQRALEEVHAQGMENVFAITGDYPKGADPASVLYALDSVNLVEMLSELREKRGMPFFISAAISPFKYTEPDCVYQYMKLEKKIQAGADFAITQLGFDSRKFRELKRYLDERGLQTPVMGNVYILPARAAERFSKGEPPGCWASPELVAQVQEEAKAPDKGLAARLERAAKMVAIVRGLGYAGAYIGGDHDPERIRTIIQRSEELAPKWEELAEEMTYAPKGAFYLYDQHGHTHPTPSKSRGLLPRTFDATINYGSWLKAPLRSLMRVIDKSESASHALERVEYATKKTLFGCKACGNCVLGLMEFVCPMTCPKNIRNGPCGGPLNGQCEVYPDKPCIWVEVYERAKDAGRLEELRTYIPQRNRELQGTSSYINYFLGRDSRPEHPAPLVQISPATSRSAEKDALVK